MTPDLRGRLADGPLLGTFVNIDAPEVVEVLGTAGYDFVVIDAEHSPLSIDRIADLLRAAHAVGVPAVVRVPELGPETGRVLDAGAAGVLVPRVESADEVAEAVGRARYAPEGFRGLGPGRGGYGGGGIGEQIAGANRGVLLAVQVETRAGVAALPEILRVPGLDAIVVGPADLAASYGIDLGGQEHGALVDHVVDTTGRSAVTPGAYAATPTDAGRLAARGARLLVVGTDRGLLTAAATGAAAAARSAVTGS